MGDKQRGPHFPFKRSADMIEPDPPPEERARKTAMHRIDANGAKMPKIGFGTWTLKGLDASRCVANALDAGYRHIDTAAMYNNEQAVGDGIRASGVPRSDIFLTTKIWHTDIADGDLQRSLNASLDRLGLDAVDLALIHWPSRTIPLADSIKALNAVRNAGMAHNIGVSNFTIAMIEEATAVSDHPLACNQIEYHPLLNQDRVIAACRKHGMAVMSYCPLGSGSGIIEAPAITGVAEKHGRTPAQIILRWHIQQDGIGAIPRSSNPERIRQNIAVFDFALDDEDMAAISAMTSRNHRICDFDFSPQWDAA